MLHVEDAQKIVLENVPAPRIELVPIRSACGYRLAEEILADRDIPPFNRSSMDGYAVRADSIAQTPVTLDVVGESRAGTAPDFRIQPGQAASIMTGSIVPEGTDAVQIIEKTESLEGGRRVRILESVESWANVVRIGSEVKNGSRVLTIHRFIGAAEMAVLATFGYDKIKVWRRPSAAVIPTGDELVEVNEAPSAAQIRNSNGYALLTQLEALGITAAYLGIARDDKQDLRAKIREGLTHDILILTGGVSMGKYDLVEDIFAEFGVRVYFDKVAIKPGKPVVFGKRAETLIFGLPGNPVSSYVTFEYFVRPAILKWMGANEQGLMRVQATLRAAIRQKPGRTAFLPAWTAYRDKRWTVEVLPSKGSADIVAFSKANSMCIFPHNLDTYQAGETVEVLLLDDFFRRV